MENKPKQRAYLVEEGKDESDHGFWTEIGALWPHKDGKGSNLVLKGGGTIVIRDIEEKEEAATEEETRKLNDETTAWRSNPLICTRCMIQVACMKGDKVIMQKYFICH